jgi:hypothetical protein
MPYGWLTEMGKGVQDDMRAVQPMKNLRVNRAILAEEDRIARENAARRMAELEAPPQSSMPMLTQQEDLAPVAMPEAPKAMPYVMGRGGQAEANAAWNSLAFQQQKELETLRARAEANEDITDEFNKTAARHQGERAQATQQYGDASPETKAGIQELLGTFGQDKTGKIAVRGRRPYNTILTAPTQGYIAQSLAQDPSAGYRGQMILLDEMNAARARATPRLQGSEGLDEYGKQIEATSSGLNQMITQAGLNERANLTAATQIEKTRMQGHAQTFAIDSKRELDAQKQKYLNDKLDLEREKMNNDWSDKFSKRVNDTETAFNKTADGIIRYLSSNSGMIFTMANGRTATAEQLVYQAEAARQARNNRYARIKALAHSASATDRTAAVNELGTTFEGGDVNFSLPATTSDPTWVKAALSLMGIGNADPVVVRPAVVTPPVAKVETKVEKTGGDVKKDKVKKTKETVKKTKWIKDKDGFMVEVPE